MWCIFDIKQCKNIEERVILLVLHKSKAVVAPILFKNLYNLYYPNIFHFSKKKEALSYTPGPLLRERCTTRFITF
jgi:hypothetical protein